MIYIMFSGIIKEVGIIDNIIKYSNDDISMFIRSKYIIKNIQKGSSVSVNGACLTVVSFDGELFNVKACYETLSKTNLGTLKNNSLVNLENSVTLSSAMDGHIVQGHITSTATILDISDVGKSIYVKVSMSDEIDKYIVHKGSIAIDGTSLTIAEKSKDWFTVAVIPYTKENTIIKNYQINSIVNIEVDIIGRYIESIMQYNSK